jgi:multidrug efflux system membrane fusion protein
MASVFKPSRILSVALVVGAVAWIMSGSFGRDAEEGSPDTEALVEEPAKLQRVAVRAASSQAHRRHAILSCVTEAENRAVAVARGAGVILELTVTRGDAVKAGDIIAQISDEGRSAAVLQAEALLAQQLADLQANKTLIERGNSPRNRLPGLEAAVAAGRAAVAAAEAEANRSIVRSPIDGLVDSVPAQIGQAVQVGMAVAEIVAPEPMLAVGAVAEGRRSSVSKGQEAIIRFIDGSEIIGSVKFVGLSADRATRTYPVEAIVDNPGAAIADGVTCEMAVALEPVEATKVPRSALIFSDEGYLGLRIADDDSRVVFVPVELVDDTGQFIWVSGLPATAQVIVTGQDFVKNGDEVEPVLVTAAVADSEEPPA